MRDIHSSSSRYWKVSFSLYINNFSLEGRYLCLRAEESEVRDIHSSSTRYWKVSNLLCMY